MKGCMLSTQPSGYGAQQIGTELPQSCLIDAYLPLAPPSLSAVLALGGALLVTFVSISVGAIHAQNNGTATGTSAMGIAFHSSTHPPKLGAPMSFCLI